PARRKTCRRIRVCGKSIGPQLKLACSMLFVKDFARMREFYSNVFGTKPVNTELTDSWAFFEVGETGFALHAIPAESAGGINSSQVRERCPVKLVFAVDDVLTEPSRLEAIG